MATSFYDRYPTMSMYRTPAALDSATLHAAQLQTEFRDYTDGVIESATATVGTVMSSGTSNGLITIRTEPSGNVFAWTEPKKIERSDLKKVRVIMDRPEMYFAVMQKIQAGFINAVISQDEIKTKTITSKNIGRNENGYVHEFDVLKDYGWNDNSDEFFKANGLNEIDIGGHKMFVYDEGTKLEFRREEIMRLRRFPAIRIAPSRHLGHCADGPEAKARKLLLRYVGEKEFRRYLKTGCVSIFAHGSWWRVPGEGSYTSMVEQYKDRKLISKFCVHFDNHNLPPTDACIMRIAMIMGGVNMLRKSSNEYKHNTIVNRIKRIEEQPERGIVSAVREFNKIYGV